MDSDGARQVLEANKINVSTWVPENNVPTKTLESFVGTYSNPGLNMEVTTLDGKLYASVESGQFELKSLTDTSFYFFGLAIKSTFQRNSQGKVTGVVMEQTGVTYLLTKQ